MEAAINDIPKFATTREDISVELSAIVNNRSFSSKNGTGRALLIASGGCTVLSLLAHPTSNMFKCVDIIDINPAQILITKLKCFLVCNSATSSQLYQFLQTPNLVDTFLQYLELDVYTDTSYNDLRAWLREPRVAAAINKYGVCGSGAYEALFRDWKDSGFNTSEVFTNARLIKDFGADAVTYSSSSFAEHFARVLSEFRIKYSKPTEERDNYFYHQILHGTYPSLNCDVPPYFRGLTHLCEVFHQGYPQMNYELVDLRHKIEKSPDEHYTFVQLSNITDWMSLEDAQTLLKHVDRILQPGGTATIRRLNSQKNLIDIIRATNLSCRPVEDRSGLYQEVFILQKPLVSTSP